MTLIYERKKHNRRNNCNRPERIHRLHRTTSVVLAPRSGTDNCRPQIRHRSSPVSERSDTGIEGGAPNRQQDDRLPLLDIRGGSYGRSFRHTLQHRISACHGHAGGLRHRDKLLLHQLFRGAGKENEDKRV